MARTKFDPVARAIERERINETRRRYYEALQAGMSIQAASRYASGEGELPRSAPPAAPSETPPQNDTPPASDFSAVEIPDDWRDLPYVPRASGAPNLRALASAVSDEPINNKKEAVAAIEAELARRANKTAAQRAATEIPDDWQELPFEQQRALAQVFTDEPVETAADVERVIQTELARRAA